MTTKIKIGIGPSFITGLIFLALSSNCAFAQTATTSTNAAQATNLRPILSAASSGALARATESSARIDRIRDQYRHPFETLSFFGINSNDTVIEIWPGQGWYSSILAPYLKSGGGRFIAAHFDISNSNSPLVRQVVDNYRNRFASDVERFGYVDIVSFGPRSGALGPANSVDYVLTYRNIHNWMNQGWTEKAFEDFFKVLKPGGYLGIEEHRASNDAPQDPLANDGYVRQDYVIDMAREAGFVLVDTSEINANPLDTKDHPFGVWTLPPVSRSAPQGQADNPAFDQRPFLEIGESDRMTLLFRKPLAPPVNVLAAATAPQPVRMVFAPPPTPQAAPNNQVSATPTVAAQPLPPAIPSAQPPVPVVLAPATAPAATSESRVATTESAPNQSIAGELIVGTDALNTTPPASPSAEPFVVAVRDAQAETAAANPAPDAAPASLPPRPTPAATPPSSRQSQPSVSPRTTPRPSSTSAATNSARSRPSTTPTRNSSGARTSASRPTSTNAARQSTTRTAPRTNTRTTPAAPKAKTKATPPRVNPNIPTWNPPNKKKKS